MSFTNQWAWVQVRHGSSYPPTASEEYSSELKQQLKEACERISQLEGRLVAAEAEVAVTREQLQRYQKTHLESEVSRSCVVDSSTASERPS